MMDNLQESKYKLQISQLEEAVLKANNNIIDYEAKIILMEREINKAQKAWKVQKEASFKRPAIYDKVTETEVFIEVPKQTRDKSTETKLEVDSVHTQCTFCSKSSTPTKSKTDSVLRDTEDESDTSSRDDVESAVNGKTCNPFRDFLKVRVIYFLDAITECEGWHSITIRLK